MKGNERNLNMKIPNSVNDQILGYDVGLTRDLIIHLSSTEEIFTNLIEVMKISHTDKEIGNIFTNICPQLENGFNI